MSDQDPNHDSVATSDASTERYSALWQLVKVRVLEFIREPASVFWVYVFPLLMMLALGIAFRSRPVEQSTIWVESGPASSGVVAALEADPTFRLHVGTPDECYQNLRTGKADLVVKAHDVQSLTYQFDATRPGSILARNRVDDAVQRAAGRTDVIEISDSEFSEPGGRYIDFLVPGLLGIGLMGGGLWGVGFAIVDLRIRNVLKRFLATPMKRTDFLGSLMLSRLVFTVPEVFFMLALAALMFGVKSQGSYFTVVLLVVVGAFEFAGIGLLVASRAKTLETASGLMNLVMIPMWIGSGVFFPVDRFPEQVLPVIRILPLTALVDALRAVMLEGASLIGVMPELGIMVAWMVVTFVLALVLFRWN